MQVLLQIIVLLSSRPRDREIIWCDDALFLPHLANPAGSDFREPQVNLATNAIKYSTPDTPIIIKLQRRDDQAVLSVHNEGREIPVDEQEKIFLAFERTQETQNSAIKGWGLGLASVNAIAKAHGSTVTFESDKIVGTTFTLKLPIRSHA